MPPTVVPSTPRIVREPIPPQGIAYRDEFIAGYLASGVSQEWLSHVVNDVVPCEHEWGPPHWDHYTGSSFYGWGQFMRSTWNNVAAQTGYTDWSNPWHQGYNMAVLISTSNPGGQWPHCWWIGL